MLTAVSYRIYQDLLMFSRLSEYKRLLKSLIQQGYTFLTVAELAAGVKAESLPSLACVIRMDVDTDLPTARRMFSIEQAHGVRTTYYFRMRTFNAGLVSRISAHGSEVGFHYEELATIAKKYGLRTKTDVDKYLPAIRNEFAKNITLFAEKAGFWPRTIASHGDFANRRLGIPNYYAIDQPLRERFGIVAEAYDKWLNAPIQARFSDSEPPTWWTPGAPDEAIRRKIPCISVLVHPRQWRANRLENARLEIERVLEGLLYRRRVAAREGGR